VTPCLARIVLASLVLLPALGEGGFAEEPPAPAEPPPDAKPAEPGDDGPDTTRGYLGYAPAVIPTLTEDGRKELGVTKEQGWVVHRVVPRSPAEKAGLKAGDILLDVNGEALPDTKGIDPKNDAQVEKFHKETWTRRLAKVKPGDVVTLGVERGGKRTEVKATAIPWEAYDALVKLAEEDMRSVQVPDPGEAGDPAATAVDFEKVPDGEARPEGFLAIEGAWDVYPEKEKPENHVLRQYSSGTPRTLVALTGKGRAYADGVVKVRFQCLDGMESVGGGVVVRMKDRKNYVVVRADGVAKSLRIVAVRDQKDTVLASADIASPKLRTWLALEVTFQGANLKAVLDGKTTVTATDDAPVSGWCGLATDADAETQFDDLKIEPAKAGAGR
jgi:hypothetical protein